jgi:limonene-1,2-epoxide hydrolase
VSVSEAQQSLLQGLFAAIDDKNVDGFLEYLTADASFRFGSAPAAHGSEAIRAAVGGFFETIRGLRHEVSRAMAGDAVLVCEGNVTYTRIDGSEIALPFVDVFEMSGDGLIADYKIYMDIAPLYAA